MPARIPLTAENGADFINMLAEFFTKNLDIVYFVYGLAFIIMGVAILIHPRRESIFRLSDIMWLLAGFGLSHGLNEWFDMFTIIKGYHSYPWHFLEAALLASSYILLFEFGRRLMFLSWKNFFLTKWITVSFCFLIFALSLILSEKVPNVLPRYFLGFPGGMLTAFGFIFYYRNNESTLRNLGVRKYFLAAAFSIAIYGILAGIIPPKADFFPASILNNDSFLKLVGIPVQAFRAICAIFLAWSIWNILGIFNWEITEKLKASLDQISMQKAYTDNIFSSIVDSLLVIGQDAKIKAVNLATQELLGYKENELLGRPVTDVFVEKEVETLLNKIKESAFLLSKDFEIIEANDAFLKTVGMEKKEVIGQHCYKLTHKIDHICQPPQDRCPVSEVNERGSPCVELHTHIDKQGKEYLVNVTAAPIRDRAGEIIYYLHLDIKKEKGQKNGLKEEAEKVKFLINKLEAYVDTLRMRRIFSETDLTKLSELNIFTNLEMYYKTKTNQKIPVNLSGSAMKDKDGNFLGIVCIVKDMREINRLIEREKEVVAAKATAEAQRKRAEEIEKVYKELEKSHAQLKQAQNQLIQAEKMHVVGRLASGVAHEVKNPLAIIIQGVEYLKEKVNTNDENISSTLKYIEDSIYRADSVIKGLLDFSVLSKLEMEPENLNFIIDSALLLMKHIFDKQHIQLTKNFKEDLPLVKIDKNRITQVFLNLILNSIQAMPDGGEIKINTYLKEYENKISWAVAEIMDTGKGIPEDILENVFEPFFTTKRDMGGTGLGLSIVRNIIEMHSGKIEIENRKDTQGVKASVMFKI